MKLIKYALLILFAAIATDVAMVFAYPSPSATSIYKELSKNTGQWTEWRTKNTWTEQTYRNVSTITWLTNPCSNCKIASKPVDGGGGVYVAVVTVAGQTKTFTDPTVISAPNDYRLNIWRFDTTLLTTIHSSVWKMN